MKFQYSLRLSLSPARVTALALFLITLALTLSGCSSGGNHVEDKVVAISVSPATASIATAQKQTFSATVTNATNTSVSWSVQEGTSGGSISTGGVYTAPATAGTYHIVATSQADSSKTAGATVTVTAVAVSVTPATATLSPGGQQDFTAAVTPSGIDASVAWSVQESGGGTITATGHYTAPSSTGTYHVIATSAADGTKQGQATVVVASPAPDFAINSSSSPSEGEVYQCTFDLVDSSQGPMSFALSSDSPSGAALSGNALSWTPTSQQSRVANVFTVTGTSSDGRTRTKSWTVTPSGTIHGVINEIHISSNGKESVPLNLVQNSDYPTEISVMYWNQDGSGMQSLTGTGHADGTFEVEKVPAGQYGLYVGAGDYKTFLTSRSSIDLSYPVLGRAHLVNATGVTTRELKLSGLTPWDSTKHMMYWYLPNTNEVHTGSEFGDMGSISDGSTTVDNVFNVGTLADASAGDLGFGLQVEAGETSGVSYAYIAKATQPLQITDIDGGATVFDAAMQVPTPLTLRAKFSISQFVAKNALRPTAVDNGIRFFVMSNPTSLTQGFGGYDVPNIATYDLGAGLLSDVDLGDMSVGNPYPGSWVPLYDFEQTLEFKIKAPGASTEGMIDWNTDYQMTDAKPTTAQPVAPMIDPVSVGTIDGKNLFAEQVDVSLAPNLTWQPTATGNDSSYELVVFEVYRADFSNGPSSSDGTSTSFAGKFETVTNGNSLQLPVGILEPGKSYVVMISARKETGTDVTATPSLYGFPRAQSTSVSGMFTTSTMVPGVQSTAFQNAAARKLQSPISKCLEHMVKSKRRSLAVK